MKRAYVKFVYIMKRANVKLALHLLSEYCLIKSELFAEVAFPELLEGFR